MIGKPKARRAMTLIELLIVVAIIGVLAGIVAVNFRLALDRALKATDAANLRVIGSALQAYFVDFGDLPPGDREAGPFVSFGPEFTEVRNGPASGGSWDGLPWILYERGYVTRWETLFCPKYLRIYRGKRTIRGEHERFHNFRYAYNSSAVSSGGHVGGGGNILGGKDWIVRDLWLGAEAGWFGDFAPEYPGDYAYPWGEGDDVSQMEHVLYSDMAVRTVRGGEEGR